MPEESEEQQNKREEFAQKDLEYPEMQLIVCRKAVIEGEKDEAIAYLNGIEGFEPCLSLRLNDLKAGEYYFLYKPDFKPWHKVKRLNIVLYSQFMQKRTAEELLVLEKMKASVSTLENKSSDNLLMPNRSGLSKNRSGMSRRSLREMPLEYDERKAIKIQRLDPGTFHDSFYK